MSEDQGPGADPWKKNAGSDPQDRGDHEARDGGRPDEWSEVDPPDHGQDRRRTPVPRHPGRCQNGRRTAQEDGLLAARQPQETLWQRAPGQRCAVLPNHRIARTLRRQVPTDHQRRYEEEGTRRHLQESGRQMGSRARARQRPRLPLRRRRHRRSLWDIRRAGQPWHPVRRHLL